MTDAIRTPEAICWHCNLLLDAASPLETGLKPKEGMVSICMYCGAVGVFGRYLDLLKPTKEFLDDLGQDDTFKKQYIEFMWARQYLMLQVSLMGPERK